VTLRSAGVGVTATAGYAGEDSETSGSSTTASSDGSLVGECLRETSLLYLLLMLGTAWLGLSLYNFTKTYDVIVVIFTHTHDSDRPQSPGA